MNHIRRHKRLVADHRGILDRHVIGRVVRRVGRAAGVPGVHPHRLRHTLGHPGHPGHSGHRGHPGQGVRLEAIAALLGCQELEVTLI